MGLFSSSGPKAACCGKPVGSINDASTASEARRIAKHKQRCSVSVFHQHWFSIKCTTCGRSV
jgi:hypothetical protein